ncbi:MAG: DMT family transporter [Xanthobacteraceae bacterium]
MPKKLSMSTSDWLLLLVLAAFWGASFFFAAIAVREIPPLTLALARVMIAAGILFIYARAAGVALPKGAATWRALAVMAVINNVIPFTLLFWSQKYIAGGLASILIATAPLFTIVVGHFVTADDRITPGRLVGLIAGFVGVIVVIGPDALRDLGVNVGAQIACLGAAIFYAGSAVYGRRFQKQPAAGVAAGTVMMSTLILLPLAAIVDRPWTLPTPSPQAIGAVFGLAVISTAAAYLIYFRILARAGATNILLVNFLLPVSAILLGVTFLGETISLRQVIGMAAIAIGLAALDGRPYRALMQAVDSSPKRARSGRR